MNASIQATKPARFQAQALATYSAKLLKELKQAHPLTKVSDAARKVWGILISDPQCTTTFNFNEIALIQEAIHQIENGTLSKSASFEEAAWPKGGTVEYYKDRIVIRAKDDTERVLKNEPVIVKVSDHYRPAKATILPILTTLVDLKKGKLVEIPNATQMSRLYDGTFATLNPAGIQGVKLAVQETLEQHPGWPGIEEAKQTKKGIPFADFLAEAIDIAPLHAVLGLHKVVTEGFVKGFTPVPMSPSHPSYSKGIRFAHQFSMEKQKMDNGNIELVHQVPKESIKVLTENQVKKNPEDLAAYNTFVTNTQHFPNLLAGPLKSFQNFPTAQGATNITAIGALKDQTAIIGGPKRGLGRLCTTFNFNPNQSEQVRNLNMTIALVLAAIDKGYRNIGVQIVKGAIPLFASWLNDTFKEPGLINVRIIVDLKENTVVSSAVQPWTVDRLPKGYFYVWAASEMNVPDIVSQSGTAESVSKHYANLFITAVKKASPYGFAIYCPVYDPLFFQGYTVSSLKMAHDLRAIWTTVPGFTLPGSSILQKGVQWKAVLEQKQTAPSKKNSSSDAALLLATDTEKSPHGKLFVGDSLSKQEATSSSFFFKAVQDMRKVNTFMTHPWSTYSPLGSFYVGNKKGIIAYDRDAEIWTYEYDSFTLEIQPDSVHVANALLELPEHNTWAGITPTHTTATTTTATTRITPAVQAEEVELAEYREDQGDEVSEDDEN